MRKTFYPVNGFWRAPIAALALAAAIGFGALITNKPQHWAGYAAGTVIGLAIALLFTALTFSWITVTPDEVIVRNFLASNHLLRSSIVEINAPTIGYFLEAFGILNAPWIRLADGEQVTAWGLPNGYWGGCELGRKLADYLGVPFREI